MAHTVVGLFDSASEAQQAVQQLVNSGISRDNIDVSTSGSGTSSLTGSTSESSYNSGSDSDLGSGSGTGFTSGSGSDLSSGSGYNNLNTGVGGTTAGGGTLDYSGTSGYSDATRSGENLSDFSTGASGTGTTGTSDYSTGRSTFGDNDNDHKESGITRFFKSLFGTDDDEVNTYSNVAQRSGSIVTVHAQTKEEAETAADILDDNGAVDVNEKASQYGLGRSSSTGSSLLDSSSSNTGNTFRSDNDNEGKSIPIIEEQLEVGKRQVQTGGVRLRSRIVETPVEESLRLREERVRVERNTVDRPATEADFANFKETEIEITEQSEVPVVSKQARVVEEISLDKEVNERQETIHDTVRSTEVDVENLENRNTRTDNDTDFLDKKNNF